MRPAFDLNEIDITKPYVPETCPCCGAALTEMASPTAPRTLTQVELPERPVVITKHECHTRWCGSCRKPVTAVFPPGLIEAGLVGPRLTALVGFLRGACGMRISAMRRHFRDVLRVNVSKGFLAKLLNKVSGALDDTYEELLRQLPLESVLNVDETGHKDSGRRFWTWTFRAATFAVFKISPSRGSEVLLEVLGPGV